MKDLKDRAGSRPVLTEDEWALISELTVLTGHLCFLDLFTECLALAGNSPTETSLHAETGRAAIVLSDLRRVGKKAQQIPQVRELLTAAAKACRERRFS